MNSKKFNSKKAGFDDATSQYELNPVDLEGFSIINTNILDDLKDVDDERAKAKSGPVSVTYVDPKTMEMPESSKSSRYFDEDLNNKRRIAGALAAIPRMVRETKHKCKTCHGVRQEYDPERPMEERIVCPDCLNHGHELSSPESGMMNRAKYALKKNRMADFHERACGTLQCNPHCAHKNFFDKIRASFPGGPSRMRTRDIKLRPNTTNPDIVDRLTPEVVEDRYKPIPKILQAMGGREDEPLQKHDVVYTNYTDTVNTGSHLKADYDDEGFHPFKETYEQPERGATPFEVRKACPTCGCKECNANGIKLNDNGDYVDCDSCNGSGKTHTGCKECNGTGKEPDIQTDQGTVEWPVVVPENVKLWEAEGRKGPKPEQAPAQMRMNSPKPLDACADCGKGSSDTNHTRRQFPVTQSEAQQTKGPKDNGAFGIIVNANPEGTRGDRISFHEPVKLQRDTRDETLGNGAHPERGISLDTGDFFDRDPDVYDPEDRDIRKHIESIMSEIMPLIGERSTSNKVRITYENNVPLVNSARVTSLTAPMMATAGKRSLIRPKSDVKGSLLPRTPADKDKKIRTTTVFRGKTGIDEETLRTPELSTGKGENLDRINDYIKNSLEPDYARLQSNNPELAPVEQVRLSSPTYGLETPARDESRRRPSVPSGRSKINEDIRSSFDLPKSEVPDMGNFDLSNPENQNDAIDTFEGNLGRKLEPEERSKAIKGITEHGHINGGYKALGMKTPEEEEDHEQ